MNIYLGNLPYEISDKELEELFGQYGVVTSVSVIKDRETRRSKGFGFIEMEDSNDAQKAIKELDNSELKGRTIKVNEARPRTERFKPNQKNW